MVSPKTARFLFSKEITSFIIPKSEVTLIHPEWSLKRALYELTRQGTNSVPVINSLNQVDGVISKADILDFIMKQNEMELLALESYKVKEAMDQNHSGILANSIFSFAFEVLMHRSYIPIIDVRGHFVGILTRKVMMEKVIEYFQEEYLKTVVEISV